MEPAELEWRRPVWDAMSELFLDTETRWAVPFVARRCAESGRADAVLDRVFWVEVFPEGIENLLQVAGDWAMLALDESALSRRADANRMPARDRLRHGHMVADVWAAALEVTAWLRDLPDVERVRHARLLELLGRRWFHDPARSSESATAAAFAGHRDLAVELWRRYEPVCRGMSGADDPQDAQTAAVLAVLGTG